MDSIHTFGRLSFAALAITVALTGLFLEAARAAQLGALRESPGESRPRLPDFEPPAVPRGETLPRIDLPTQPGTEGLSAGIEVFVREIRVSGYSVFSDAEIAEVVAPYVGRRLSFLDLTALRNDLTLVYVDRGYRSSGAVIPDQRLDDGVLRVAIVEGILEGIEIETDGRFRESVLRKRVEGGVEGPVNVYQIERALQVLQVDPRILRVEAQLLEGEHRGGSILHINVREATPFWALLEVSNYQSPSIGKARGEIVVGHRNLTGVGDELSLGFRGSGGLLDFQGRYICPLNRYGTSLEVLVKAATSKVVGSLAFLDIESDTQTIGLELRQPVYQSSRASASLFAIGQYRRSSSSLLGRGFQFTEGPSDEGVAQISALRLGGEWTFSDRRQVFALRSTFNIGLDILGATSNSGNIPDGEFFYWLAQAQWARRLHFLNSQVVVRTDVQISDRPLLVLEQFAMGGHSTVRGYRENTLVRDNGVIGSIEFRVPVWTRRGGETVAEIVPFFDAGYSWQADRTTFGPTTLLSAGLGLRWWITDWLRFRADWGARIKDIPDFGDWNLQQEGLQLALTVTYP